jgi:hypothetical protein
MDVQAPRTRQLPIRRLSLWLSAGMRIKIQRPVKTIACVAAPFCSGASEECRFDSKAVLGIPTTHRKGFCDGSQYLRVEIKCRDGHRCRPTNDLVAVQAPGILKSITPRRQSRGEVSQHNASLVLSAPRTRSTRPLTEDWSIGRSQGGPTMLPLMAVASPRNTRASAGVQSRVPQDIANASSA